MALLQGVGAKIPEKDREIAVEYIKYNEWGLAFEQICEALVEDEIVVTSEELRELDAARVIMKLPARWLELMKRADS